MILNKWINYLLILIAVPLCAVHCCDHCCDGCGPDCIPKDTPFVWDSISTQNLDNSSEKVIVSVSNSVPKGAYGIRLNFKTKPYTMYSNDTCLVLIPSDTITNIRIFTKYDFDATHPANSDISEYFKVGTLNSLTNAYSYNRLSSIHNFLNSHDQKDFDQIDLLLMTAPQLNNSNEFSVVIDEKHSALTLPVPPINLF